MKKQTIAWISHLLWSGILLFVLSACQARAFGSNPVKNTPTSVVEKILTQTVKPSATPTIPPPTATFTPTPNIPQTEPSPTDTPTSIPNAEEKTEVEILNGLEPDHPCYHPYLPVDPSRTWVYRYQSDTVSDGSMLTTFTIGINTDSFLISQNMMDEQETSTVDITWFCAERGLVSSSFAVVEMPQAEFQYGEIAYEGITLPENKSFQPGNQWQTRYETEAKMNYQGRAFEGDVFVVQNNTLTGFESVTVPAGTFETARVDSTYTIQVAIGGFKMTVAQASGSSWYAENIGLIKSTTKMQDSTSSQELLRID